ncbi:MAG: hypothetical protein PHY92_03800, partial [Alphaproteobacteria bacterium]|nr:hypothetical protein [Alphaproteobacteria bacterium]
MSKPTRPMPRYVPRSGSRPRPKPPAKYKPYKMRVPQVLWLVPLAMLLGFGAVLAFFAAEELKTSKLQAAYLSTVAREIRFEPGKGPNPAWRVPVAGPYNQRLGYSYLPDFIKALG